tara:strand:- start:1015 stop:1350 length:336 start_codon:yes stop_codon:yes gene_type:complete
MFKRNLIISLAIFFVLLSFASYIKTETRKIEKDILNTNKENSILKKNLLESQVEFFYLTSPNTLSRKIDEYGDEDYVSLDYSKIFMSLKDFTQFKDKTTKFFENEKKSKKK